ncbi:MAG: sulfatase [Labilithrix sp.]|nr:sulfatase [Labilithrix sp.]
MRRSLLTIFGADIAAGVAILTVTAFAFAAWRAGGAAERRLRKDASAELAAATETTETTDGEPSARAEIDSAQIDAGAPPKAERPRAYNVILITVDTLRFDIGFMGYPRPVSPNIDALAARSVVYEHAYAMASFTPKCLGPLLIGKYSSEVYRDFEHYTNFPPANLFLAERVQDGGGRTMGAATHRYFGWKKGFDQGFDVWDTSAIPPNSVDNDPTITSEKLSNVAIGLLGTANAAQAPVRAGEPVVTVERTGPAKDHFFAWFHYLDPHLPYVPHQGAPAFATMPAPGVPPERAAYDAEVWFTDAQVGRLLAHIAEQPWANETVIVLTSDHGEAFGERGHRGHGRELWEPLVHVPLLVYVPGVAPRRIQAKRSHIDVVPTVIELMGLPADAELHGTSLLRDLDGAPGAAEERDVYIDMPEGPYNEMRRAVLTGPSPGLKLIDFGGGRYELFDLRFDPAEAKNLAPADPAQLAAAKDAMTRMRDSLKVLPPTR